MAWKRVVRPSVWLSFSLGNGGGLHGNDEVSDVYLVWKPGPRVARPDLGECFVGRNRVGVFVWMRRPDYCNWSALLKQSLSRFFSVCLCKVCVWVCFCACVCAVCAVSCLFLGCSHRGASRNMFSPLWQHFPRHHCTTQHLCLFALGLPAPAVIRKDRKTGLWSPMQTLGPMLS